MKIALTGPFLAGKTTLAEYLRDNGRFYLLSYTDIIKRVVHRALNDAGKPLTLEEMKQPETKELLRPLYNAMGAALGFMREGFGIEPMMAEMRAAEKHFDHFVFDNVRSNVQANAVRKHGFVVVGLECSTGTQRHRAYERGMTDEMIEAQLNDPAEMGCLADLWLPNEHTVEERAATLLRLAGIPLPPVKLERAERAA